MRTAYKYRYNGKEQLSSFQGRYDYGFRMYDAGVARFLSVDPLTKKYPELTPYQFASNTPIQAIDLDGLEAFFVHGTMSNPERYKENPKAVDIMMSLTNNVASVIGFKWGTYNGYDNQQDDRFRAAMNLTSYVMDNLNNEKEITLIGHSHGGNVAIQALPMIRKALAEIGQSRKLNLITISTPAYNGANDPENPINSGADSHRHYYSEDDIVNADLANLAGKKEAMQFYKNSKTKNKIVDVRKKLKGEPPVLPTNPLDIHGFDLQSPEKLK